MIPLKLGTLESVDLRQVWLDEARDFTPWLAQPENLELLSDALSLELEFEGMEVPVGPYRVDIVAHEALTESRAIIENQLERTDHDHLGKLICYAAGRQAKIVIWIAREFTEEHRQAIDFLNQTGSTDLRFYAVQVRLLRIGDSLPAPHFEIISSPNEYLETVKKDQGTPSATGALYLEFWESFRDFCVKQGTTLNLTKPRARQWYNLSIGRSQFALSLSISAMRKRISCEIYLEGQNAKQAFKLLQGDKAAIEEKTGPLEWMELPAKQDCRIIKFRESIDIENREQWPTAFAWLSEQAKLFLDAFSEPIRRLVIDDDAEEGTEGP
jgi:Domain of unknown function (DUF4268)